jgi:hypothetical protein
MHVSKKVQAYVTIRLKKTCRANWLSPVAPQVAYNCYANNSQLNYFLRSILMRL